MDRWWIDSGEMGLLVGLLTTLKNLIGECSRGLMARLSQYARPISHAQGSRVVSEAGKSWQTVGMRRRKGSSVDVQDV